MIDTGPGFSVTGKGRKVWAGVSLFAATILAYFPCLPGDLLWDDDAHVTRADLRSLTGLGRIWFKPGATQQYYPVLHSAFWIEHRLWGDSPLGYHLLNVLLHATAACLLVAVLRRLWAEAPAPGPVGETVGWAPRRPGLQFESLASAQNAAWLAGFIFALHPICVESVAWISEQKNTLSAVFYFAAALAYLRFDEGWAGPPGPVGRAVGLAPGQRPGLQFGDTAPSRNRGWRVYSLATALFILALLTKTVTATLPAALLVALWWRRGRISLRRDGLPLAPWIVLGLGLGIWTAWVERNLVGAKGAFFELGLGQRCLLAGRAVWFYAAKVLWPAKLIFVYPRWNLDPSDGRQFVPPIACVVLILVLWLFSRWKGWRGTLAGYLFFAGTLLPALGFFSFYTFRYTFVADHFQYLACLGLIVPLAAGVEMASTLPPRPGSRAMRVLTVAGVSVLAVLTWRQSHLYRNNEVLYETTLERNPQCWMAHNNLGEFLSKNPARLREAIFHFQASLRLNPLHAEAENNLGVALISTGRTKAAIAHYESALRINPNYAEAHNNLANALIQTGRLQEAIAQFETALRIDPAVAEAQNNLGNALLQSGRIPEAIARYEAALRLSPDYVEAHNGLAAALFRGGRVSEAVEQFQAALRIRPDDPNARENLRRIQAYLRGSSAR